MRFFLLLLLSLSSFSSLLHASQSQSLSDLTFLEAGVDPDTLAVQSLQTSPLLFLFHDGYSSLSREDVWTLFYFGGHFCAMLLSLFGHWLEATLIIVLQAIFVVVNLFFEQQGERRRA